MDEEKTKNDPADDSVEAEDKPRSSTSGDAIAQELLPVSLETEMRRSYLDYAMSVIVGRALPDVRDGFKPVHRRVLYAMKEIKNTWNNPTKKAARVVGEVLGKYHPHGDAAAYQTIVRMAQDFSLRYPLVFGQGNFGSIDGDGAAAMRYTEVRLERIAETMLQNLHEDTVDFVPNFDNSEKEPVVLPTVLPQLIVNGSSGIAVGMATNIPPHNLSETVDGCLLVLDRPECSVDEVIRKIPAPDFPTGGIVFGLSGVHQGYRTGRGRVVMRASTHFESFGRDRTRIVVDEIPYMVNKRFMYERIHELWREKKLEGISEMRDESERRIRIAIDLKQGAVPEVVLNNLFKLTQMQETFSMNMVALVEGQPMLLNLKQMIEHFLAHRREVVTRRTVFFLKKARAEGHLLEGQAIALANIDEFIRIIRSSRTVEEATERLFSRGWDPGFAGEITRRASGNAEQFYPADMDRSRGLGPDGLYYLTRVQIQNILSMNLRRLTGLEQEAILADYRVKVDQILDLIDILAKPGRVTQIIREELLRLREDFADARRSKIDLVGDSRFDKRDLLPRRDMIVTFTRDGYVKSQELVDYNAQRRGGLGRNVQATTKGDAIDEVFTANTHDILLCFSTLGKAYYLDVFDLPEGKASSRGRPIVNLLQLEENEKISFVLPVQNFEGGENVIMATDTGLVKKTPLAGLRNAGKRGVRAANFGEGDRLIGVALSHGGDDIMIFTDAGRAVRFSERHVRSTGRTAGGVRGVRLFDGARATALVVLDGSGDTVLVATARGFGKRVTVGNFPLKGRGGKGAIVLRSNDEGAGAVVSAVLVSAADDIMLLSANGKLIRTRAGQVPVYSRTARGVHLIRLEGDELLSVRKVPGSPDEEVEELLIDPDEAAQAAAEAEEPEGDEFEEDSGAEPEEGEDLQDEEDGKETP